MSFRESNSSLSSAVALAPRENPKKRPFNKFQSEDEGVADAAGVWQNLYLRSDAAKPDAGSAVDLRIELSAKPEYVVRATVEAIAAPAAVLWAGDQRFTGAKIRIWRARQASHPVATPHAAAKESAGHSGGDAVSPSDHQKRHKADPADAGAAEVKDGSAPEGKEEKGEDKKGEAKLPGMRLAVEPEEVEDWELSASGADLDRYTTIPGIGASLHRFWHQNETAGSWCRANNKALAEFKAIKALEYTARHKTEATEVDVARFEDDFFAQPHVGYHRGEWGDLDPNCLVSWMRMVARQSSDSMRVIWNGYCEFLVKHRPELNRPPVLACVAFALLQRRGIVISKDGDRYLFDREFGMFGALQGVIDPDSKPWLGGSGLSDGVMKWLHDTSAARHATT